MDIKKYEILLRVIDRGSFVKACQDFGYTQSGITHMMNSLESEVGVPLLLRTNKGVKPSLAGEQMLPLIRKLLQTNEQIEQELAKIRGMEVGKIRVGCLPSVACVWMPQVLCAFREKYPLIHVELMVESDLFRLEKLLSEDHLDLAFLSRRSNRFQEWIPLKNDPYLILLPKQHRLAGQSCTAADLSGETVFCSADGAGPELDRYFEKNGVVLRSWLAANSDHTIVHMVRHGLGIGVLPELSLKELTEAERAETAVRTLMPPFCRALGIAARSDRSPAMTRFIECFQENLQKPA